MRFSELSGKEIINLRDGQRLGSLGECELQIDEATGLIAAVIVPPRSGLLKRRQESVIPWTTIRRVGPEVMIVELENEGLPRRFGRN